MKHVLLLSGLLSIQFGLYGQLDSISGAITEKKKLVVTGAVESNAAWYNRYDEKFLFFADSRFASNTYLKTELRYGRFHAGVQYELYKNIAVLGSPIAFNGKQGIGAFYGGYQSEKIDITAGYIYDQFGSGLAFRTWEDRQLGLNNALIGGRLAFRPTKGLEMKLLGGNIRNIFSKSDGEVYGADLELQLNDLLKIKSKTWKYQVGSSYVLRHTDYVDTINDVPKSVGIVSLRAGAKSDHLNIEAEWLQKSKDVLTNGAGEVLFDSGKYTGNALLIHTSYTNKSLGVNFTLRKLRNMDFRAQRGSMFVANLINYMPALTPQHHFSLQNIYPYNAQGQYYILAGLNNVYNVGEVGGIAEVYYNFPKKSVIGGKTGLQISTHYGEFHGISFEGDPDLGAPIKDLEFNSNKPGDILIRDYGVEVKKSWNKKFKTQMTYTHFNYNGFIIESGGPGTPVTAADFIALEGIFKLRKKHSIQFDLQHLWARNDIQSRGNWAAATVEYSWAPHLSFYATDLYNYGNTNKDQQIHFYSVGSAVNYKSSRLSIGYGRQRQGLFCVGGVCRLVPASSGFNASFNYIF
jgi:hypothetical protein